MSDQRGRAQSELLRLGIGSRWNSSLGGSSGGTREPLSLVPGDGKLCWTGKFGRPAYRFAGAKPACSRFLPCFNLNGRPGRMRRTLPLL